MKRTLFFSLFALFLIAGFCLTGCDDSTPGSDKDSTPDRDYATIWTFRNDSGTNVNVTLIIGIGDSTVDSSWSMSSFSLSPNESIMVGNYEERNTIFYSYGPSNLVKTAPYVSGSYTIVFVNI